MVVILIGLLKTFKPEFVVIVTLFTSVVMLVIIVDSLKYSFEFIEEIYNNLTYGKSYFPIILKILGIAYVTEFAVALCNDAGEKAIGSKIELAGKIGIFFAAIPVFVSLLELMNGLL